MAVRHDRSVLQRVPALVFLLLFDVAGIAGTFLFGDDPDAAVAIVLAAFVPNVVLAWLAARLMRQAAQHTRRTDELIKVSLFLAAFSGMYFAAHMARDEAYRSRFFEPLVTEVAITLAARDIYLAVWHGGSPAAAPESLDIRGPPDDTPPAGADALAPQRT